MTAITAELVPPRDVTYGRSPVRTSSRRLGADQAQHRADQAGARDARRRHHPAGHLHAAVRVRVRRRDPPARRRQLPRVPDRRDARDGPGRDRAGHGGRAGHRHVHRADRPVPVAADVALGRAGGTHHGRTAHPDASARSWWSASAWPSAGGCTPAPADVSPRSAWPCCSATRSPGRASAWAWCCAARRRPSRPGSSSSCR